MILTAYILATLAMIFIAAGLVVRRDRARHIPFMIAAFVLDTAGVLIVEIMRQAVENIGDAPPLTLFHAAMALIAWIFYIVQIVSGRRLMKDPGADTSGHRRSAGVFLVTRVLAYITMFWI